MVDWTAAIVGPGRDEAWAAGGSFCFGDANQNLLVQLLEQFGGGC